MSSIMMSIAKDIDYNKEEFIFLIKLTIFMRKA